jgi:uncharacterized protein with GYD domain
MAKYLVQANYTEQGAQGLAREGGSKRAEAVAAMVESLGGRMEAFYYALGDVDAYVVLDLPDNISAAALSLAVNSSGAVNLRTTPLLTPQEADEAFRRNVSYRAPGR